MKFAYEMNECPCKSATVYLDRAEVSRTVKANVKQGENEIVINNLSQFIDEDSVRFVITSSHLSICRYSHIIHHAEHTEGAL